ncbi:hypothetical protein HPC49_26935 [Pyxidicoccus fallax]|uniref:Lipoprotein n=1 Tax=Pyxidicoccus fallax TaxID=394095 RepID=A0A848LFM2_9BACT|nr:hypothetical protein [Pyxidicoccus fallax]NMO15873.1 hypothetical protein [Pyxidicoccus fallax]NPC81840.1 hypothetical protein [Pyxidicoccus fallax]
MMRDFKWLVLFAALLGACRQPPAPSYRVDGLYFADHGIVSELEAPKLLLLEQGRFELLRGKDVLLSGTFDADAGVLRLRPVNGAVGAELEATYAVVDGRLLLGVLRRVDASRPRWRSAALPAEFLGLQRMAKVQPGAFSVDWDMDTGEWRFTSGEREVVLSGVARVESSADGERAFVPVFQRPERRGGGDDPEAMLQAGREHAGGALEEPSPFGLMVGTDAELVWRGGVVRTRNGGSGPWEAARPYERRGSVMVTPWTVDLGPVGLLPVRAEPAAVAGTYEYEDEAFVVSAQPPPSRSDDPYATGFRYRGDEQRCHYVPDERGLVARDLGMDHPPMSHWDKPVTLFCFSLGDGRFVRYVSAGGCNGGSPADLTVFHLRGG